MKTTTRLRRMIDQTRGRIFSVRFTKADGTERLMICRTGVKAHLKGGDTAYDFRERGVVPVFDMLKGQYRSFRLDRVLSIRIFGIEYTA